MLHDGCAQGDGGGSSHTTRAGNQHRGHRVVIHQARTGHAVVRGWSLCIGMIGAIVIDIVQRIRLNVHFTAADGQRPVIGGKRIVRVGNPRNIGRDRVLSSGRCSSDTVVHIINVGEHIRCARKAAVRTTFLAIHKTTHHIAEYRVGITINSGRILHGHCQSGRVNNDGIQTLDNGIVSQISETVGFIIEIIGIFTHIFHKCGGSTGHALRSTQLHDKTLSSPFNIINRSGGDILTAISFNVSS